MPAAARAQAHWHAPASCAKIATGPRARPGPCEKHRRISRLFRPEIDRGLELIPAAFAGPQMPDATLVDMLRPLRSQQSVAALGTGSDVTGPGRYRRSRTEPHGRNLPRNLPRPMGTLVDFYGIDVADGDVVAKIFSRERAIDSIRSAPHKSGR